MVHVEESFSGDAVSVELNPKANAYATHCVYIVDSLLEACLA